FDKSSAQVLEHRSQAVRGEHGAAANPPQSGPSSRSFAQQVPERMPHDHACHSCHAAATHPELPERGAPATHWIGTQARGAGVSPDHSWHGGGQVIASGITPLRFSMHWTVATSEFATRGGTKTTGQRRLRQDADPSRPALVAFAPEARRVTVLS